MRQIRNYGDERQLARCVYCGKNVGKKTRDHVPSEVFLDKPYPENLPVVPACNQCNHDFSSDEEYVACLIECARLGSTNPNELSRAKIKRKLQETPALKKKLENAQQIDHSTAHFVVEVERLKNVALKLGRGHAAFELNEPQFAEPSSLSITPLATVSQECRMRFETPPIITAWPEVGSRSMQRDWVANGMQSAWITVQDGRYRYLTTVSGGIVVRIVMSEYLAIELSWP